MNCNCEGACATERVRMRVVGFSCQAVSSTEVDQRENGCETKRSSEYVCGDVACRELAQSNKIGVRNRYIDTVE